MKNVKRILILGITCIITAMSLVSCHPTTKESSSTEPTTTSRQSRSDQLKEIMEAMP